MTDVVINPEFYARTNARLDALIDAGYEVSPAARYLASSSSIDRALFARHTIETILRIRLARIADSKVTQHFASTNPFAAQKWCKYTAEEMLQDRLFLTDLRNLGVSEETVYGTDSLLATKLLQGYLYYTMEHEGPRGVVSKAYFIEYAGRKTLAVWNGNARQVLGEPAIQGAEAHLDRARAEDHSAEIWNVLMSVVKTPDDEARVHYHLEVYFGLFVAYFNELATTTKVDVSRSPRDPAGATVWGAQRAVRLAGTGHDAK